MLRPYVPNRCLIKTCLGLCGKAHYHSHFPLGVTCPPPCLQYQAGWPPIRAIPLPARMQRSHGDNRLSAGAPVPVSVPLLAVAASQPLHTTTWDLHDRLWGCGLCLPRSGRGAVLVAVLLRHATIDAAVLSAVHPCALQNLSCSAAIVAGTMNYRNWPGVPGAMAGALLTCTERQASCG